MSEHAHDIKKEVRGYLIVFVSLLVLTIVTVAVSYLKVNIAAAISIALFIATIKAALVACCFMHLISEQKLIYSVLGLTTVFFIAMIILFVSGRNDKLVGSEMIKAPIVHASDAQHK